MSAEARQSPLLDAHKRRAARLTDFAGWDMPLQFEGVVSEHNAVRSSAGVFDVSHLGKLRVRGAGDALQRAVTADVLRLAVGRATYSLVLNDDGGCVDDIFVYRVADDEWLVVPNAANVDPVAEAIRDSGGSPVDEWDRWAILALQGPRSDEVFGGVLPRSPALQLKLHDWCLVDVQGKPAIVARTGYTGERGLELYAPAERAESVWEQLIDSGATPAGLGARDTLRLEMGYALYGHELSPAINPLEAGLGWAIAWSTDFRGRAALAEVRARGPARQSFGIRCVERGIPRVGFAVVADDREVGHLTSGNFSPTLNTGIGLALGPVGAPPEGSRVYVSARGRMIGSDIVKPPFITR